jgi:predicted Kef-type K+ transport protein
LSSGACCGRPLCEGRLGELSHRAAEESLPLRDAFSVLFFVSVGMLFDPTVRVQSPFRVLGRGDHFDRGQSAAVQGGRAGHSK